VYNGTQVTIIGNLGADPELRFTPNGRAVASFTVAVVMRRKTGDKWEDANTTWYNVNVWGNAAENVAESLTRGSRVILTGTLMARPWEDREGNKRYSWEITADAVGADMTYASVKITKTRRDHGPAPEDPWSGDTAESAENGHAAESATAEPAAPADTASTAETAGNSRARSSRRATRSGASATPADSGEPPF
jgi:single-strand DNA-binding protein